MSAQSTRCTISKYHFSYQVYPILEEILGRVALLKVEMIYGNGHIAEILGRVALLKIEMIYGNGHINDMKFGDRYKMEGFGAASTSHLQATNLVFC